MKGESGVDRMLRPKMKVLPDAAMVETAGTYSVSGEQPYFLKRAGPSTKPAGTLPAGSKVKLVSKGGAGLCLVEDSEGRLIHTAFAGLRPVLG